MQEDCSLPPFFMPVPPELQGVGQLIESFRQLMSAKPSSIPDLETAMQRLEKLQHRFCQPTHHMIEMADLVDLQAALLVFMVFLYMEIPASNHRQAALDGLLDLRGRVTHLQKEIQSTYKLAPRS